MRGIYEVLISSRTTSKLGYLHLHAHRGNLLTVAHDKMESKASEQGLRKNTPLDEVIYMMNTPDANVEDTMRRQGYTGTFFFILLE